MFTSLAEQAGAAALRRRVLPEQEHRRVSCMLCQRDCADAHACEALQDSACGHCCGRRVSGHCVCNPGFESKKTRNVKW
jgi:hypothetical protein